MTDGVRDINAMIDAVLSATTDNFVELCKIAGLDPTRDFRKSVVRGANFEGCDLSEFDFSGATLVRSSFSGARFGSAKFEETRFSNVDLSRALDWNERCRTSPIEYRRWTPDESDRSDFAITKKVSGRLRSIEDGVALIDVGGGFARRVNVGLLAETTPNTDALEIGDRIVLPEHVVDELPPLFLGGAGGDAAPENWDDIASAYKKRKIVFGMIFRGVKGGFIVRLGTWQAFLPGGQVERAWPPDVSDMLDDPQPFEILSTGTEAEPNIVVSRLAVLERAESEMRLQLLWEMRPGDVAECKFERVTASGILVSVQGITGLIHQSNIEPADWENAERRFTEKSSFEAVIIAVDREKVRLGLSLTALNNNPWPDFLSTYKANDIVEGVIRNHAEYGVFLDVDGITGLVHSTNIPPEMVENLVQNYPIGEKFDAVIRSINRNGRVDLSFIHVANNPWPIFLEKYSSGDILHGVVLNKNEHGLFVDVFGVVGLVPMIRLAPVLGQEKLGVGDQVVVKIVSILPKLSRVALDLLSEEIILPTVERQAIISSANLGEIFDVEISKVGKRVFEMSHEGRQVGFLPVSKMRWRGERSWRVNRANMVGRTMRCCVIDKAIRSGKELLVFGTIDLIKDPFDEFVQIFAVGDIVLGKIKNISVDNALVDLCAGLYGFDVSSVFSESEIDNNQWFDFKIENIDMLDREITVSVIR